MPPAIPATLQWASPWRVRIRVVITAMGGLSSGGSRPCRVPAVVVAAVGDIAAGEDVVDLGPVHQLLPPDRRQCRAVRGGCKVVGAECGGDVVLGDPAVGHGEGDDELGEVIAERR